MTLRIILALILVSLSVSAIADSEPAWMSLGARPMCAHLPAECAPYDLNRTDRVVISTQMHHRLHKLNRQVNGQISYITDQEHYGTPEHWTYPTDGYGDCEDYVLEKRRRLIAEGWPRRALLMTVVRSRDTQPQWHAVLTVRTDVGDIILDNQTDEIMVRELTPYVYLFTQSQTDPMAYEKAAP